MARIGDYVNPAFGAVSYDNLMAQQSDAAKRRDQNVSSAVGAVGDAVKLKKDYKDVIKVGTEQIKAISTLFGDESGAWAQLSEAINDEENAPLSARAGMASSISDITNMQVKAIEQGQTNRQIDQKDTQIGYEGDRVDIAQAAGESMNTYRDAQTEGALMQNDEYLRQVGRQNMLAPFKTEAVVQYLDSQGTAEATALADKIIKAQDLNPEDPTVAASIAEMIYGNFTEQNRKELIDGSWNINGKNYEGKALFDRNTGTQTPIPTNVNAETIDLASQMGGAGGVNPVLLPGNRVGDTDLETAQKEANLVKTQQDIAAGEQEIADARGKRVADIAKADRMLTGISSLIGEPGDDAVDHPGLDAVVGMPNIITNPQGLPILPGDKPWPGTQAAGARAIIDQLKAQSFLEGIQQMKGMGALSNAEGEKAAAALTNLDVGMKLPQFKETLGELRNIITTSKKRLLSGELVNPDGSPMTKPAGAATPEDPAAAATSRLRTFQGP